MIRQQRTVAGLTAPLCIERLLPQVAYIPALSVKDFSLSIDLPMFSKDTHGSIDNFTVLTIATNVASGLTTNHLKSFAVVWCLIPL